MLSAEYVASVHCAATPFSAPPLRRADFQLHDAAEELAMPLRCHWPLADAILPPPFMRHYAASASAITLILLIIFSHWRLAAIITIRQLRHCRHFAADATPVSAPPAPFSMISPFAPIFASRHADSRHLFLFLPPYLLLINISLSRPQYDHFHTQPADIIASRITSDYWYFHSQPDFITYRFHWYYAVIYHLADWLAELSLRFTPFSLSISWNTHWYIYI